MIYDSYPWKKDLLRRKQLILKYNTQEHFEKDEKAAYTVLEKAVFYSAFIIRKLIDCEMLSDEADIYSLKVKIYKPKQQVYRYIIADEESHNLDHFQKKTVKGKDVCNWLIHSYIFNFVWNENTQISEGFFVASDFDRNKLLYYVGINDWIDYMDFIVTDSVVATSSYYDGKEKDFVSVVKCRGSMPSFVIDKQLEEAGEKCKRLYFQNKEK